MSEWSEFVWRGCEEERKLSMSIGAQLMPNEESARQSQNRRRAPTFKTCQQFMYRYLSINTRGSVLIPISF